MELLLDRNMLNFNEAITKDFKTLINCMCEVFFTKIDCVELYVVKMELLAKWHFKKLVVLTYSKY